MITTEKTAFVYGGKTVNNTKIPVTVFIRMIKVKIGQHVNLIRYIRLILLCKIL